MLPARKTKKTAMQAHERAGSAPRRRSACPGSTGTSGCAGTHSAERPSTATTPAASASAAPGYFQPAITSGGSANSTAAVTDSSTPWRTP